MINQKNYYTYVLLGVAIIVLRLAMGAIDMCALEWS